MKASTIFTTLAAAIPAFAAPMTNSTHSTFGAIAIHSTAEYHQQAINASNLELWIRRPSTSFCPTEIPASSCPSGNSTLFTTGASNTLSLAVSVPGGQQIYVAADGSLRYTQVHSAAIPSNASQTGFSIAENGVYLQYNKQDFLAIPIGDAWKVYASVDAAPKNGSSFAFRIVESEERAGAWQY